MSRSAKEKLDKLFVYGTLLDPAVLREVAGRNFPSIPAYLADFVKLPSVFGYPYIIPGKESRVDGLLIGPIDAQTMRKLDDYEDEGRLYFRQNVTVFANDIPVFCSVYVGNPELLTHKVQ